MKKCIFTVLCVLSVLLTSVCTGCHTNNQADYHVYTVGVSDGGIVNVQTEYAFNFGETYEKRLAPKEASTTFRGRTFTGRYKKTMTNDLYPHEINQYESEDHAFFWLDAKTGELRYMNLIGFHDETVPEGQNLSEEECAALAETLLSQQLDDFEEYTLSSTSVKSFEKDVYTYYFTYCRKVGGLNSRDEILVNYRSTGALIGYDLRTYGTLKNVKLPHSYDEEKVTKSIQEKVDDVCASLGEDAEVEYTEKSRDVIRLQDGSVGLMVRLDLRIRLSGENTELPYSDAVYFYIELD